MSSPSLGEKRAVQCIVIILAVLTVAAPFTWLALQDEGFSPLYAHIPVFAWSAALLFYGLVLIIRAKGWLPTRGGVRWYEGGVTRFMGVIYYLTGTALAAFSVIAILHGGQW